MIQCMKLDKGCMSMGGEGGFSFVRIAFEDTLIFAFFFSLLAWRGVELGFYSSSSYTAALPNPLACGLDGLYTCIFVVDRVHPGTIFSQLVV
jgi:hypothetical protein